MRRWVTHPPRDFRPRHFLFTPHLHILHPEVDQEVKQESFKKPFAILRCLFVGFLVRGQYQDASSLFARVCYGWVSLVSFRCVLLIWQVMRVSYDLLRSGRLRLVLSVNRLVASGLTDLSHGEGWFREPRKWSNFSMWALVLRCSCEKL